MPQRLRPQPGERCLPPVCAGEKLYSLLARFPCSVSFVSPSLVLVSAEVDATALRAGFTVDVGVDVLFEVADEASR